MEIFLSSTLLYFKNIITNRKIIFFIGVFVLLALFIIPNEKSNYITFYIGTVSGVANNMWVSNLNAIFINIIFSFFGLFIFEGITTTEYDNNRLVRCTSSSNLFILLHRWLAYVLILLFFGVIITLISFFINYKEFNFFSFLYPFCYFSVPFIFLLASFILIIDSFIKKKTIKILLFIVFFLFVILINKYIDLFGVYEFMNYIKKDIEGDSFSIGFIKKTSNISFVTVEQYYIVSNLFLRFLFIPLSVVLIYLYSFVFDRYKKIKKIKKVEIIPKAIIKEGYKFSGNLKLKAINIQVSLVHLFSAFFLLFRKSFSKLELTIIIVLWFISFFINHEIARNITIPLVFLTSFNLFEKYFDVRLNKRLEFIYRCSVFNEVKIVCVSILIVYLYFVVCLLPLFIANFNIGSILLRTFLFSIFLSLGFYIKTNKPIEIMYILIFICYLCGFPIVHIF